jgi:ribose transport system permease protein
MYAQMISALWPSGKYRQEHVVLAAFVVFFVLFGVFANGFLTVSNIVVLVRNVSILGVLGLGMAIVVIGRGIDLSMISVMAVSGAWAVERITAGAGEWVAVALALVFAGLVGVLNGVVIAYGEISPLLATLASGILVYGFGRAFLVHLALVSLPKDGGWFTAIGQGAVLGVPAAIIFFAVMATLVHLYLSVTRFGRFTYAMGSNPKAAWLSGIPFRGMIILQYALSACIAAIAGLLIASTVTTVNMRIVNSTMIYDVILVVVLGGIGLSGGTGRVRQVVIGTLLIGVLLNGMTIMDMQYTTQNIIKAVALLSAVVIDSFMNPRDEQTAQQGDI